MDSRPPWYRSPWGIAVLAYLLVTGVLGIAFLVTSRRVARTPTPSPLDTLRAGGFTEAQQGAGSRQQIAVDLSVPIFSDSDPAIGSDQPRLVVVEYSDFQCPFCRAAFPIIREAVATYGDRGLRLVYRDFPVDEIHTQARGAAEAAQCAHAQGKFWAYHDKLFQNAEAMSQPSLFAYAEQVGLDRTAFESCIQTKQFAGAVEGDYQAGVKLGVKGTPTWFLLPGGDPKKARRVEGVIPREALLRFLERTLR
jgi:protein-disulfide isomerase